MTNNSYLFVNFIVLLIPTERRNEDEKNIKLNEIFFRAIALKNIMKSCILIEKSYLFFLINYSF